ncbi:hypothetical protein PIB30_078062 [Stylosanthes scabra]|uniref:Uncharacterized protein n=1 Tax=Stylosanthes scabra TaxID=79078 RepID=A0ABU6TQD1_9FABA|nr:hypothetical protein [Stylosanthes scabra]
MVGLGELNANPLCRSGYEWVKDVVWSIPSKFVDAKGVKHLGPPSFCVRSGKEIKIEFLLCSPFERAKGVGRGIWVTLSSHQGRIMFSPFKASYKDFKEFYIKRRRPVQCLRIETLSERDAELVEFLFLSLKGGKVLTTSELLKWESDRDSVVDYLDCSTAGLKSFFKQRTEKDVSTSNVVKMKVGSKVHCSGTRTSYENDIEIILQQESVTAFATSSKYRVWNSGCSP